MRRRASDLALQTMFPRPIIQIIYKSILWWHEEHLAMQLTYGLVRFSGGPLRLVMKTASLHQV